MYIKIDNTESKPIYEQITEQMIGHIIQGTLEPMELLPSIRVLAKDIKVSVITTKRVYEELEKAGYIETLPGKGSFVLAQNTQMIKEHQLRLIQDKLEAVLDIARQSGITQEEVFEVYQLLEEA